MLVQIKSILTNKTHVETKLLEEIFKWKLENKKLLRSDLSWPFDLGLKENIKQVVTTTGWPPGDGIDWQVWSEKNKNNKNQIDFLLLGSKRGRPELGEQTDQDYVGDGEKRRRKKEQIILISGFTWHFS